MSSSPNLPEESFRDTIATISEDGKRNYIHPKKPSGPYYEKRKLLSYLLLTFLIAAPFVKINGNQFLLFNVLERRFNIFGFPFWPQDFHLFVMMMIVGVVGLTLFTVAFGRIFCGWFCPQTIFMEMVFRRIEYWIDGDRGAQIRLAKQDWNAEKIRKRVLKLSLFFIFSFFIANVFLAYLIGSEKLFRLVTHGPQDNVGTLLPLLIFTGIFYFVFAWFREQVCTLVCPYGRLQGVLIDKQTINVFYDFKRGENRAKWRKGEDRKAEGKGDCIDCNQCVVVCPTGIDIRNGQQLECINCTMCIDACDEVMVKTGLPKGLIRYATQDEIEKEQKFKFTVRMKAYTLVLIALLAALVFLLNNRGTLEAKFIKPAGSSFYVKDGKINNTYNYTFLNKSNQDHTVTIKVLKPSHGEVIFSGENVILLKKDKLLKGTVNISFPQPEIKQPRQNITIGVYDKDGKLLDTFDTYFEGPFKLQF